MKFKEKPKIIEVIKNMLFIKELNKKSNWLVEEIKIINHRKNMVAKVEAIKTITHTKKSFLHII